MDYRAFEKACDYIDSQRKKGVDVSAAEVSNFMYYSLGHLNAIFKYFCNESLGKFIKNRKLDDGGVELFVKGTPINIVANRVGYDPGSFTKAFKAEHNMLPQKIKNVKRGKNMSKVIAIGFSFGGAGTSTLALITGALLADQGNKVLIIDASLVSSISYVLACKPEERTILMDNLDSEEVSDTVKFGLLGALIDQEPEKHIISFSPNFHLLPNDGYLGFNLPRIYYDKSLRMRIEHDSFKQIIEKLKSDYNYIIIDTHYLGLSEISDMVIKSSDRIVIPLHARAYLLSKVERALELIEEKGLKRSNVIGVFRRDFDIDESDLEVENKVRSQFGEFLSKSFLPYNESARKAVCGYDELMEEVKNRRIPVEYCCLISEFC
ncbi:AAA family ATPase [Pelosinus fermentans]|uniref:Cobyrinic acid ac-diamide synthase n=2 Tax=Pelosinus TaxID=365348 RepID=I8RDN5_9FIRM|nr:AAA family ATPase [Pelosinus fermentans]EIW17353.1 Cobyrinic acid ac-diamide synthase [Pelosinus fermentans B4]EIW23412.1 Helix-turn-helix, AraC domain-containing protein [Pelosinus fermentans A11]